MNFFRVINDWLHLTMAVIWIGGLYYHFVVLGATAKELPDEAKRPLVLGTFKRFTRIIWVSIILLFITGIFKGIYLRAFGGLFYTNYGWIFGIKLLLALAMMVVAIVLTFVLGPELHAAVSNPYDSDETLFQTLQNRMSRLVRTNLLLGMLILLAVVMLAANP